MESIVIGTSTVRWLKTQRRISRKRQRNCVDVWTRLLELCDMMESDRCYWLPVIFFVLKTQDTYMKSSFLMIVLTDVALWNHIQKLSLSKRCLDSEARRKLQMIQCRYVVCAQNHTRLNVFTEGPTIVAESKKNPTNCSIGYVCVLNLRDVNFISTCGTSLRFQTFSLFTLLISVSNDNSETCSMTKSCSIKEWRVNERSVMKNISCNYRFALKLQTGWRESVQNCREFFRRTTVERRYKLMTPTVLRRTIDWWNDRSLRVS